MKQSRPKTKVWSLRPLSNWKFFISYIHTHIYLLRNTSQETISQYRTCSMRHFVKFKFEIRGNAQIARRAVTWIYFEIKFRNKKKFQCERGLRINQCSIVLITRANYCWCGMKKYGTGSVKIRKTGHKISVDNGYFLQRRLDESAVRRRSSWCELVMWEQLMNRAKTWSAGMQAARGLISWRNGFTDHVA